MPHVDAEIIDYEAQIMAGLIPSGALSTEESQEYIANLLYVMQRIDVKLLRPENQALLQCMDDFRSLSDGKGVMDEQALLDILNKERAPAEIQVKYTELYASYARTEVSPAKLRFVINRWLENKDETDFVKLLNDAFTMKTVGLEVGKSKLIGYKAAKDFLVAGMHDIDRRSGTNFVPEGDVRIEAGSFVEEMKTRKDNQEQYVGVLSGFTPIDSVTNGAQPGELLICLGYTEVGKTFFCLNWAHNAVTLQGKNVVVATSEVPRPQYTRRLYLRHCRNPIFGLPQGIDSDSFKKGRLTPQEEDGVAKAMKDFETNPAYGKLDVFQVPAGADLAYIFNKVNAINTKWKAVDNRGVEFFVMDSLNHLTVANPNLVRQIQNERIKQAKHFAVNFDQGRGIPFLTPWHANRSSWEQALKDGHYKLSSGEEANELEKSADLFSWLLKLENAKDTHEILGGIEKYRDGPAQSRYTVYEDFASSYMGTVSSGNVVTHTTSVPPAGATAKTNSGGMADPRANLLF